MATGLHGSARTTARVQAELQASQESARALHTRYGLNVKTVAKLRSRSTTADKNLWDLPSRVAPSSRMLKKRWWLSRRRTLLPLDDLLGHPRETLPQLTRSALHRCLVRHGISRLPSSEPNGAKRGKFTNQNWLPAHRQL